MILLLFFMLLLYLILTLAIVLLNRRFPFDRLAGVEYESTVRVKKEIPRMKLNRQIRESGTEIGNSLEFDFVVSPPHS